jgi:hypothetical protein
MDDNLRGGKSGLDLKNSENNVIRNRIEELDQRDNE